MSRQAFTDSFRKPRESSIANREGAIGLAVANMSRLQMKRNVTPLQRVLLPKDIHTQGAGVTQPECQPRALVVNIFWQQHTLEGGDVSFLVQRVDICHYQTKSRLAGWLAGRLAGWPAGWLTGCQTVDVKETQFTDWPGPGGNKPDLRSIWTWQR